MGVKKTQGMAGEKETGRTQPELDLGAPDPNLDPPQKIDQDSAPNPIGPENCNPVVPAIFNIFQKWGLEDDEQKTLLGLPDANTLCDWKKDPEKIELTKNSLDRMSYILAIYASLQTLVPEPDLADKWLSTPNDNPLFSGSKPLGRMLNGEMGDLATVRDFLYSVQNGW